MPEIPGRDEQILQAIINGTEYTQIPQSRIEHLLLQLKAIIEGGMGVSDYTELENKPSINNVTLVGNKSLSDLGIVNPMMIKGRVNSVSDLPQVAEPGWVYFVGRSDDADLREYVYTVDSEWEFLGYLSIIIDSVLTDLVDNGPKNKLPKNNITQTGRWASDVEVQLPAGDYVIYFGSLDSTDIDATKNQIGFFNASFESVVKNGAYPVITRGTNVFTTFTLVDTATKFRLYSSDSVAHGEGDTVTATNIMICPKAYWDISTKYVPYLPSNAEMYQMILDLQNQS